MGDHGDKYYIILTLLQQWVSHRYHLTGPKKIIEGNNIYIYMWVSCRESWIWRKTCFLNYTAVKSLLSTTVGRIAEHVFSVVKHPDLAFLRIPISFASGFWHVGFLRVPKDFQRVVGALGIQLSLSMFGTYSPSIPITQKWFRISLTGCSKDCVTFLSL